MKFLLLVILVFIAFIYADISLIQTFENIFMTLLASIVIASIIYILMNLILGLNDGRKIKNLDNQDYINLHDGYYQNKKYIFFEGNFTKINCDYFKNIGNKYASDSKNIYFEGEILNKKIDIYSFKYLGGNYCKDNNNVYYDGNIIENIDSYSFKVLETIKYKINHAIDKNNYIIDNEIIGSNDIENIGGGYILHNGEYSYSDYGKIESQSLISIGDGYAVGDKFIYLWGEEIFEIGETDTYKNLGYGLLQINDEIIYYSQKTDIKPEYLQIYSKNYIGDKKNIYHLDDSHVEYIAIGDGVDYDMITDIEVSDIKSFKILSDNVATDNNKVYHGSETMGDSNTIKYLGDDYFIIDGVIIPSYDNHI